MNITTSNEELIEVSVHYANVCVLVRDCGQRLLLLLRVPTSRAEGGGGETLGLGSEEGKEAGTVATRPPRESQKQEGLARFHQQRRNQYQRRYERLTGQRSGLYCKSPPGMMDL